MLVDDFITSRQVFHLKTDSVSTDLLRHDVLVRNGLIYRFSRIINPDIGMVVESDVIDTVLKAGVRAIPVMVKQTERDTYQVMRKARGTAVADLPIEQKRTAWLDLAGQLRKLHQIKGTGAGLIVNGKNPQGVWSAWEVYIKHTLPEHAIYTVEHQLLPVNIASEIMQAFIDWKQEPPQGEGSLLHGDLNDHNLFAQDGRLTDIIDWEDAMVGDPIFELAGWCCFMGHPEEEWPNFLDAYFKTPADREDTMPLDFVRRFWLYHTRIALARLVQLHRYGFKDLTRAKLRVERGLWGLEATL